MSNWHALTCWYLSHLHMHNTTQIIALLKIAYSLFGSRKPAAVDFIRTHLQHCMFHPSKSTSNGDKNSSYTINATRIHLLELICQKGNDSFSNFLKFRTVLGIAFPLTWKILAALSTWWRFNHFKHHNFVWTADARQCPCIHILIDAKIAKLYWRGHHDHHVWKVLLIVHHIALATYRCVHGLVPVCAGEVMCCS